MKNKCYNSGKISGIDNIPALYIKFWRINELICSMGYNPVDPLTKGLKFKAPWFLHMMYDVILLIGCDAILMQQDWKDSKGAKIEFKIAKLLGKKIIFE